MQFWLIMAWELIKTFVAAVWDNLPIILLIFACVLQISMVVMK